MHTLRLPRTLDELDLDALNRQLHAGEITLDWHDVEPDRLQPQHLLMLFAGLDLTDCYETIGGDAIPEALTNQIYTAFLSMQNSSAPDEDETSSSSYPAPPVWQPEEMPPLAPTSETPEPAPLPASPPATKQPLLVAPSLSRLRDELEEMVIRDLLGPAGGENEEMDEARVRDRYLVGRLAPGKTQTEPEEMEEQLAINETAPDEGATEAEAAQKPTFSPASIGLSFCVDRDTPELRVTARWGHYMRAKSETLTT